MPFPCHKDAKCAYMEGGDYSCECKEGYTGDGYKNCEGNRDTWKWSEIKEQNVFKLY